ncbi:MAG: hypothetical protein HYV68_01675 [Candidatus Taylorbacteria bacterium]|nr:hypothetical protein [Candidatus Taylorbacteria bacterium]
MNKSEFPSELFEALGKSPSEQLSTVLIKGVNVRRRIRRLSLPHVAEIWTVHLESEDGDHGINGIEFYGEKDEAIKIHPEKSSSQALFRLWYRPADYFGQESLLMSRRLQKDFLTSLLVRTVKEIALTLGLPIK